MKYSKLLTVITLAIASSLAAQPTAYVLNTTGETLSRVNLSTGFVENDFMTVGSDLFAFPNQVIVRDQIAYVVTSGTNEIHVIDLSTDTTIGFIDIGVGTNPYWMVFYDDRIAYVSALVSNEVVKVDVQLMSVVSRFPVGTGPEGMIIADGQLYVAHTGFDLGTFTYGQGEVWVFDIGADTVVSKINVGTNPQYLALDRNGLIHAVCTGDYFSIFGVLYSIDAQTEAVTDSSELGGSPGQISIGPDNRAYIAAGGFDVSGDGQLYSFDANTMTVIHDSNNPIVVDSGCTAASVFQDSTCFASGFGDTLRQVTKNGLTLDTYGVGDGPIHITFNYRPGDINGDWSVDIADVTYLVSFMFKGGPGPVWPVWRANVNGKGEIDIADLTYAVAFSFKGGSPPIVGQDWRE